MCRAAVHRQRDRGQPSEASSAAKAVALGLGHDPECAAAYEIPRWNALRPAAIRRCREHLERVWRTGPWTPPWLASLTSYRGRWQSGQVRSYVRPLDAALMAAGPHGVREIGSKSETRTRRSSASCWFCRPRLADRLPLPCPPSCLHSPVGTFPAHARSGDRAVKPRRSPLSPPVGFGSSQRLFAPLMGPVKRHGIQVSKETWVTVGSSQEVADAVRGDPCRGRTKTLHR